MFWPHGVDGELVDDCYDFLYDRKLKDNEFSFSHGRLNTL